MFKPVEIRPGSLAEGYGWRYAFNDTLDDLTPRDEVVEWCRNQFGPEGERQKATPKGWSYWHPLWMCVDPDTALAFKMRWC